MKCHDSINNPDPYAKHAETYDKYVEPFNKALRRIMLKMSPVEPGMKVLEVGCGTGTNLKLYQEAGCCVSGLDLSPSMLAQARDKLDSRADLRLGDGAQMPFSNDTFDLAVVMLTLHEIPATSRLPVIRETARVVSPNGYLLFVDYHPGPLLFPMGWVRKAIMCFFEISAGREHFKNYRAYLVAKGLPPLIQALPLSIEKQKVVGGGNMALILARRDS